MLPASEAWCELRRSPIPRTTVHKGIEKGRVPLQKHCDRCGCRESHVGSDQLAQNLVPPESTQVRPPQQSSSVVHRALVPGLQQVLPAGSQKLVQH